ncbi:SHOCT domain-containing protein [Actinoplanes sp. CA-252034]|uniref:SHOCT domain-containing protein n=1 Tax=Actinoplanes sp. CA-252034 TaxID=3239906 RepID=UPI003D9615DC
MSLDDGMTVPDHCVQALERARRHSVDTTGALAVAHTRASGTDLYLIIYPDRLELAGTGGLMRTGAGREQVALTAIDSVTARDRLIRASLEITTGGNTLSFSTDKRAAAYLAALIRARMTATPDNTALLNNLAALHTAGVLTDEEYATKRAALLGPPTADA